MIANAMSLIIPPFKFHEEKGSGRAQDFPMLKTNWSFKHTHTNTPAQERTTLTSSSTERQAF